MSISTLASIGIWPIVNLPWRALSYLLVNTLLALSISGLLYFATSLDENTKQQQYLALGGDIAVELNNRDFTDDELAFFVSRAEDIARSSSFEAIVANTVGDEPVARLAQIRAVDENYPLRGVVITNPSGELTTLLGLQEGRFGAVIPGELASFLGIAFGEEISIGNRNFVYRGNLVALPDQVGSQGLDLPTVLVPSGSLTSDALRDDVGLFQHIIQLNLPQSISPETFNFEAQRKFDSDELKVATPVSVGSDTPAFLLPYFFAISILVAVLYSVVISAFAFTNLQNYKLTNALLVELGASRRARALPIVVNWLVFSLLPLVISFAVLVLLVSMTSTEISDAISTTKIDQSILPMVFVRATLLFLAIRLWLYWFATMQVFALRAGRILVVGSIATLFLLLSLYLNISKIGGALIPLVIILGTIALFSVVIFVLKKTIASTVMSASNIGITLRIFAESSSRREYFGTLSFAILMIVYIFSIVQSELRVISKQTEGVDIVTHYIADILPEQRSNLEESLTDSQVTVRRIWPTAKLRFTSTDQDDDGRFYRQPQTVHFLGEPPDGISFVEGDWLSDRANHEFDLSLELSLADELGLSTGDRMLVNTINGQIEANIVAIHRTRFGQIFIPIPIIAHEPAFTQFGYSYLAALSVDPSQQDKFYESMNGNFSNTVILASATQRERISELSRSLRQFDVMISLNLIIGIVITLTAFLGLERQRWRTDYEFMRELGASATKQFWNRMSPFLILMVLVSGAIFLFDQFVANQILIDLFRGSIELNHQNAQIATLLYIGFVVILFGMYNLYHITSGEYRRK